MSTGHKPGGLGTNDDSDHVVLYAQQFKKSLTKSSLIEGPNMLDFFEYTQINIRPPLQQCIMDPLSIVSLAAAAVQFADFGIRLFRKSIRVYTGVREAERTVVQLETISRDLLRLSKAVNDRIVSLKYPGRHLTTTEAAVLEICATCETVSNEILPAISKIRGRSVECVDFGAEDEDEERRGSSTKTKLQSFLGTLKLVWSEDEIVRMERRLLDIRSSLMLAMISDLWYRSA